MVVGIVVASERVVPPDDPQSNYRMVRETLLARKVAVTTVVMARGMHPDALIQVEFVAAADRQSIADAEVGDASPDRAAALRAGGLVFASGQRAGSRDSGRVQCPGDVVGQTRIAYSNLAKVLATAGVGLDAVVHTTEFVTRAGLAEYRRTADVRREIFESCWNPKRWSKWMP